ncbi:MAG TPA: LysM domain-containing protein [Thermoleophilaceae bacterium]|nr:LysM domain-containing protein [Thermoleophilaceae bacterium]
MRFLAPIALIAAALLFFVILGSSLGGGGEEEPASSDSASDNRGGGGSGGAQGSEQRTYEVQSGDTLEGIAEDTGVSVDTILELNPSLDPQSLAAGERIKLRE